MKWRKHNKMSYEALGIWDNQQKDGNRWPKTNKNGAIENRMYVEKFEQMN